MTEQSPSRSQAQPQSTSTTAERPPSEAELRLAHQRLSATAIGSASRWEMIEYVLFVEQRCCECCGMEYPAPARHPRVVLQNRIDNSTKTISLDELRERTELRDIYGSFLLDSGARPQQDSVYPTLPRRIRHVTVMTEFCDQCFAEVDERQGEFWPVPVPPHLPPSAIEILENIKAQRKQRKQDKSEADVPLSVLLARRDNPFNSAGGKRSSKKAAGKRTARQKPTAPKGFDLAWVVRGDK